jgi:hypothetical protein
MGSGSGAGGGDSSGVLTGAAGGGEGAVPRGLVASAKSQSVNEGSQMSAPMTTRDVQLAIAKHQISAFYLTFFQFRRYLVWRSVSQTVRAVGTSGAVSPP